MRFLVYFITCIAAFISISCEEVIHVDLNTGDPRYVIEGEMMNLSSTQTIRVTQTVAFDSDMASKPINDAVVTVTTSQGRVYAFTSVGDGYYRTNNFMPAAKLDYTLSVKAGEEMFSATERMLEMVEIDSVGTVEEMIFNELNYSVVLKFPDPGDQENYYKYLISVNGGPFKFIQAASDKFNNGLYVAHQLADFANPFELGDAIVIRRQMISKPVFNYWNEIQMMNPGSAAPANPKSNISNGAFGYFSVSNTKEHEVTIQSVNKLKSKE